MRSCGKPASNQMALPGFDGADMMEDARRWAARHYEEFSWYKEFARSECEDGFKASPNFCLQSMRRAFGVGIPNAYAPALARIAMEQDSRIEFRTAQSKFDGYTSVIL